MKKLSAAIFIALAVISLSSCHKIIGSGPVVTESRSTREFSKVECAVPGSIHFIPSENYEITLSAQRNILDVIETYVSGDELKVKVRNNTNIKSHEEITIIVRAPSVNVLALSGSGNLDVAGNWRPVNGRLSISGSGNISANSVETNRLELNVSGSGNIEVLTGKVDNEKISISGSGNIDVSGVEAKTAETHTSGSGSIRLWVTDELETHISGSGDVLYKGSPTIDVRISGSGRLSKL